MVKIVHEDHLGKDNYWLYGWKDNEDLFYIETWLISRDYEVKSGIFTSPTSPDRDLDYIHGKTYNFKCTVKKKNSVVTIIKNIGPGRKYKDRREVDAILGYSKITDPFYVRAAIIKAGYDPIEDPIFHEPIEISESGMDPYNSNFICHIRIKKHD